MRIESRTQKGTLPDMSVYPFEWGRDPGRQEELEWIVVTSCCQSRTVRRHERRIRCKINIQRRNVKRDEFTLGTLSCSITSPRYVQRKEIKFRRNWGAWKKTVTDSMGMQAMKHGIHPSFEPRADITRSPKQGYQWPHKNDNLTVIGFLQWLPILSSLLVSNMTVVPSF